MPIRQGYDRLWAAYGLSAPRPGTAQSGQSGTVRQLAIEVRKPVPKKFRPIFFGEISGLITSSLGKFVQTGFARVRIFLAL